MKKLLLLLLLVCAVQAGAHAQTPLPNGNFEEWEINTEQDTVPKSWGFSFSAASVFAPAAGRMGGKCAVVSTWYQYVYGHLVLGAPAHFGIFEWDKYGVPFTDRPARLTGYYRYTELNHPDDSAGVQVLLKKTTGSTSYDTISFTRMHLGHAETWTYFEVPLSYQSTLDPDMLVVYFVSRMHGTGYTSESWPNRLYLDDLQLSYQTTTGAADAAAGKLAIELYPNPAQGQVQVRGLRPHDQLQVWNTLGQLVLQQAAASANELQLALAPGLYVLSVQRQGKIFANKQFCVY